MLPRELEELIVISVCYFKKKKARSQSQLFYLLWKMHLSTQLYHLQSTVSITIFRFLSFVQFLLAVDELEVVIHCG